MSDRDQALQESTEPVDPRADLVYSDFMDVATRIGTSYAVVYPTTSAISAWTRGAGQTFAALKAAGVKLTREQVAAMLEHMHVLAQRSLVRYPGEGDPAEGVIKGIEALRRGEKP